jgi:hypothetical protein
MIKLQFICSDSGEDLWSELAPVVPAVTTTIVKQGSDNTWSKWEVTDIQWVFAADLVVNVTVFQLDDSGAVAPSF